MGVCNRKGKRAAVGHAMEWKSVLDTLGNAKKYPIYSSVKIWQPLPTLPPAWRTRHTVPLGPAAPPAPSHPSPRAIPPLRTRGGLSESSERFSTRGCSIVCCCHLVAYRVTTEDPSLHRLQRQLSRYEVHSRQNRTEQNLSFYSQLVRHVRCQVGSILCNN